MEKEFYFRHLPHFHPPEATYFITFRLKNSLPKSALHQLQEQREIESALLHESKNEKELLMRRSELQMKYFGYFDSYLDKALEDPLWLKNPRVAALVSEAIHYRDSREFDLFAFCVMPNHVHLVINVSRNVIPTYKPLFRILQSLKRHTALQANKLLKRTGPFWQDESYDHVIRDDAELEHYIRYVAENPVKAGFVKQWRNCKWTYVKGDFISELEL